MDSIFVSSTERKSLSEYLESNSDDLSLSQRFSRFLERAHSIIFGRFFSSRLFSIGFFASAATISVISFAIVIGIQLYMFPELFANIPFDGLQVALFSAFIGFNVCFDYLTIIQTKIFIETSLSARSIFRSLVFIGADLIVTMNTFIICYAFFVLVVVQWFVWTPVQASLVVPDARPGMEINIEEDRHRFDELRDEEFVGRIKYWGPITGALIEKGAPETAEKLVVYYYSTFDPRDALVRAAVFTGISSQNLTNLEASFVSQPEELRVYKELINKMDSFADFGSEDSEHKILKLNAEVDGSVFRGGTLTDAYTSAFFMTDMLEDAFPASVLGPTDLQSLSMLIKSAVGSELSQDRIALCFDDGALTKRLRINSSTVEILNSCEQFLTVTSFWATGVNSDLAVVGRDIEGYRAPFNTLFITSILPTTFFYFAIILLAISSLCISKIFSGTNRIKKFFLRAPLAISGLVLGATLSITGLV
ncbi:MAG: hypothetical protein RLN94_08105 [Roseovarius sp.]